MRCLAASLVAIAASLFLSDARAQELSQLSLAELAEERGGFMLPNGVEVEMGAVARTVLNGEVVLETQFTWTEEGLQTESVSVGGLTPNSDLGDNGFTFVDADGVTAFAHGLSEHGLANIVINQADNRDIAQSIAVSIALPNFDLAQARFSETLMASRLMSDMELGLIFGE